MAVISKFLAFATLTVTALSATVPVVEQRALGSPEFITVVLPAPEGRHASTFGDCTNKLCNEACYQHGGSQGGKCNAKGECECQKPKALDDIVIQSTCDTYADCSSCWFYERCCYKEAGNQSTEKGTCMCGTGGREKHCA